MKLSETRDKDGNLIPEKLDQLIAEHERFALTLA